MTPPAKMMMMLMTMLGMMMMMTMSGRRKLLYSESERWGLGRKISAWKKLSCSFELSSTALLCVAQCHCTWDMEETSCTDSFLEKCIEHFINYNEPSFMNLINSTLNLIAMFPIKTMELGTNIF